MNIQDSVAIITGAFSGAGQAVALQLARRNIHGLALVDSRQVSAASVQMINQHAGDWICCGFHGDLANAEFRRKVYRESSERCGTANICVAIMPPERGEVGLIGSLHWAQEMVARLAADRRRKHWPRWQAPEPLQGIVIFVASETLLRHDVEQWGSAAKKELHIAAQTLAMDAEQQGVGCRILFSVSDPFVERGIKTAKGKSLFPSLRVAPNTPPQALSQVICSLIEASAYSRASGTVSSMGNGHRAPVLRKGISGR